jgi:hypothetical protein
MKALLPFAIGIALGLLFLVFLAVLARADSLPGYRYGVIDGRRYWSQTTPDGYTYGRVGDKPFWSQGAPCPSCAFGRDAPYRRKTH